MDPPLRSGTPDETNWRETAENIRARSRGSCGPDLSARVGGRRRHRLVFPARIVFRAL
jgi:hypothetical protein